MADKGDSAMRTLCVFGKESTATEIAETVRMVARDWELRFVIRDHEEPSGPDMMRDADLPAFLRKRVGDTRYIIPFADGAARARSVAYAEELGLWPMTIIHPRSVVSPSASVGTGCYLAPGAILSSGAKLGSHSILNLNATFGHDSRAGRHFVANPGAAISGRVTIGERVLVGANAFLGQGISVGDDCRIDALSHVARDLPPGHLCTSRSLRVYPRRDPHG